jgi:tRNA (cytidine/uridine-2'-O-)-methyltransferase
LRLLLFTTAAETSYLDFAYSPGDILMFGRESAGVPDAVHQAADARLSIPMRPGCARSMWRWWPPWHWGGDEADERPPNE